MKTIMIRCLFLLFALTAVTARADRVISIASPPEIPPGGEARFMLAASTDRTDGEQVGFLHAEYSTDGGKTWRGLCYLETSGASVEREVVINAEAGVSMIGVRLRAAFRGGRSGDVDFRGRAIDWGGTWAEWRSPPARFAIIYVR